MYVSIIVPVFNVENFLPKCIDSILEQTYSDFELILIDDGSTDNSPSICDDYRNSDPRIKVIHKANEGVSIARNTGLDIAKGDYITFCDSDDYWDNSHLEALVNVAINCNADCVITDFKIVDEDNTYQKKSEHLIGEFNIKNQNDTWDLIFDKIVNNKLGWEIWTRLFNASIIKENGIRFPETCQNYAEDLGFVLAYSLFVNKVVSINVASYNYRLRNNSMMRSSETVIKLNQMNEISFWFYNIFKTVINNKTLLQRYAVIHFLLMYLEFKKFIFTNEYKNLPLYMSSLKRPNHSKYMFKNIKKNKKHLIDLFGKVNAQKILLFSRLCHHQNWKRFGYESAIAYRLFIRG